MSVEVAMAASIPWCHRDDDARPIRRSSRGAGWIAGVDDSAGHGSARNDRRPIFQAVSTATVVTVFPRNSRANDRRRDTDRLTTRAGLPRAPAVAPSRAPPKRARFVESPDAMCGGMRPSRFPHGADQRDPPSSPAMMPVRAMMRA
jgi:hypothetical protein